MLALRPRRLGRCLTLAFALALAAPASGSRAQVAIDISANLMELDEKKKKAANKRRLKANQPEIEHFKKRKFVNTMSDDEEDRVVQI